MKDGERTGRGGRLRVTTDRIIEWFAQSPMAEQMEREAQEAESLHNRRVLAYERLRASEARKAELPALQSAYEAAAREYRRVVVPAAKRASDAKRALEALDRSIRREQNEAELLLRATAKPVITRDGADLWHNLLQAQLHIQAHGTSEAPRMRERLGDLERTVGPDADAYQVLAAQLEQIDTAEAALPPFAAALERLREVQLEVASDLDALIDEVTAGLPSRCPVCNVKLRLAAGPPTEVRPTGTEGLLRAQREP